MSFMGQFELARVFCSKCYFRSTSIKYLRFKLYIKNFKQSDSYETQSILHDLSVELWYRSPFPKGDEDADRFCTRWHANLSLDRPRV